MQLTLTLENGKLVLIYKDAGRTQTYRGYSMTALLEIIKGLFNEERIN